MQNTDLRKLNSFQQLRSFLYGMFCFGEKSNYVLLLESGDVVSYANNVREIKTPKMS